LYLQIIWVIEVYEHVNGHVSVDIRSLEPDVHNAELGNIVMHEQRAVLQQVWDITRTDHVVKLNVTIDQKIQAIQVMDQIMTVAGSVIQVSIQKVMHVEKIHTK